MVINYDLGNAIQEVIDGKADPIEVLAFIKEQIAYFEKCKEQIEDYAISEAEKFGAKSFEYKGFKVELREGSRRFNFKNIPQWQKLSTELKDVEEQAKMAFAAYEKGKNLTVTEDGEVMQLPEVSYSKKSLIIKKA